MSISKRVLPALLAAIVSLSLFTPAQAAGGEQKFANHGECKLESGESIKDCRIGYRTIGTLNADKSNVVVVLLPTWGEQQNSAIAQDFEVKWIDATKHFIVVIDTLGNKLSIGPDNSKAQPGQKFPKFTIRDMVEINRRLLKEELKLDKVYAVLGEHLGGMQALQWMIAYPGEMQKVIAIAATPKADDWDQVAWMSIADILNKSRTSKQDEAWAALGAGSVHALMFAAPPYRIAIAGKDAGGPRGILDWMQNYLFDYGLDRLGRYADAIVNHNAYKGYGETAEKAGARVTAKLLVMILPDDQVTSTLPMLELAKVLKAKVVELEKGMPESWIGGLQSTLLQNEIRAFLQK